MGKLLKELSLEEYTTLNKMGLLYEFYPEATGSWEKDCNKETKDDAD